MVEKIVSCPGCGREARLTLIEQRDPLGRTEGHSIHFACADCERELTEIEMLRLWAADHADAGGT